MQIFSKHGPFRSPNRVTIDGIRQPQKLWVSGRTVFRPSPFPSLSPSSYGMHLVSISLAV